MTITVTTQEIDERLLIEECFVATVENTRLTINLEHLLAVWTLEQIAHEYACRFLGFGTFELDVEGSRMWRHGT